MVDVTLESCRERHRQQHQKPGGLLAQKVSQNKGLVTKIEILRPALFLMVELALKLIMSTRATAAWPDCTAKCNAVSPSCGQMRTMVVK